MQELKVLPLNFSLFLPPFIAVNTTSLNALKNFIKKLLVPFLKLRWEKNPQVKQWLDSGSINPAEYETLLFEWQKFGEPSLRPHKIKQQLIARYQKKYDCNAMVETGTYMGDMIFAQLNNFKEIYSIELAEVLFKNAQARFKNHPSVKLLHGDSGKVLKEAVPQLSGSVLFWLDGHYCGGITAKSEIECPIYDELRTIFNSSLKYVILIDDARYFKGERDYPTIDELTKFVESFNLNLSLKIEDDAIIIEQP